MAGAARVLRSPNPKRTFVAGLLVLLALGMTSCGGGLRSCTANDATGEDLVPYETTIQPGDKVKLNLYENPDGLPVVWKTDAPATINQEGVFTAPSQTGRYRVTAEYTPAGGISLRAGGWVTVKPVEKPGDDSFSVDETPTAADPASLELVLEVSNPMAVSNGGKPPSFTLTEPRRVREITTYHWNDGKGTAAGGTITLTGPGIAQKFKTTSTGAGQGGVPNAVWIVAMDVTLKPGKYTISDSDPSTWAQNSDTGGLGMTWVRAEKR
jgi:hypothetical protein